MFLKMWAVYWLYLDKNSYALVFIANAYNNWIPFGFDTGTTITQDVVLTKWIVKNWLTGGADYWWYHDLTTIGGPWYFGKVLLPQRLINHEILLLQKFNDIGGKVLKPPKNQPPTSEKKLRPFFSFKCQFLGDLGLKNWQFSLKVFVPTSKM